jgi:hypothetical protein
MRAHGIRNRRSAGLGPPTVAAPLDRHADGRAAVIDGEPASLHEQRSRPSGRVSLVPSTCVEPGAWAVFELNAARRPWLSRSFECRSSVLVWGSA